MVPLWCYSGEGKGTVERITVRIPTDVYERIRAIKQKNSHLSRNAIMVELITQFLKSKSGRCSSGSLTSFRPRCPGATGGSHVSDSALQLTMEMPILTEICAQLGYVGTRLSQPEAGASLIQEWYTLRRAVRLKRGVEVRSGPTFESFYRTLCAKPHLRPAARIPDARIGGAAVWHRDTIRIWLKLTDKELEEIRKAS
jgi:hypothetical protein